MTTIIDTLFKKPAIDLFNEKFVKLPQNPSPYNFEFKTFETKLWFLYLESTKLFIILKRHKLKAKA